MIQSVLVGAVVVLAWTMTAARLERWQITAPMAMVAAGLAIGFSTRNDLGNGLNTEIALNAAELILALLLFVDATAVKGGYLGHDAKTAVRLLLIALPLTILIVMGVGLLVLPGLGWTVVLLIACIIAPTDFAPATSVVHDVRVPERVRHLLNVESGYNDGVVAPVFIFALTLAGSRNQANTPGEALQTAIPAALLAVLAGSVIGAVAAVAMNVTGKHGWSTRHSARVAAVALPLLTYTAAVAIGGNGFVAAFICGIAYKTARHPSEDELGLAEDVSSLCGLLMWFVFGSTAVLVLSFGLTWGVVIVSVVALTVARLIPVLLTLLRTDFRWRDRMTIGFLAPRGAASIVFGLLAYNSLDGDAADVALSVMSVTVLASVAAHGVGASAFLNRKSKTS
ncbi:sodium:proton antiporter [Amycolatopsis sp. BJA-103]|uniref:cation:proton antiporter n=1 Tax=unclassified Amycolatopsis TaxID=2618356 RepID=UPI000C78BB9A|nr:cation:proton antiporter [Amycolatopsis sp. BJA-103]AUI59720.1 sodium:proton exchanger [Amycolatopsis sp. BJA-103]PNE14566.1 sodium:proton exchanger [Amycolatopsis sp. BJA-103]